MLVHEGSGDRSCKDFIISPKFIHLFSNVFWRVLHLAPPACRLFLRRFGCVQSPTQSPPSVLPWKISSKELDPHHPSVSRRVGEQRCRTRSVIQQSVFFSTQPPPTCYFIQGKFEAERKFLSGNPLRFL